MSKMRKVEKFYVVMLIVHTILLLLVFELSRWNSTQIERYSARIETQLQHIRTLNDRIICYHKIGEQDSLSAYQFGTMDIELCDKLNSYPFLYDQ